MEKQQIPVDMQSTPEVGTPLNYKQICIIVGELYMESFLKLNSLRDELERTRHQYSEMVQQLQKEKQELESLGIGRNE